MDKVCEEYHKGHGIIVKSSLSYVKFCSNRDENKVEEERAEKIDTRLQEVTIEDVEDEDEDTAPLPLITDVKVHRENSLSSSKFSDKTSLKVSYTFLQKIKGRNVTLSLKCCVKYLRNIDHQNTQSVEVCVRQQQRK